MNKTRVVASIFALLFCSIAVAQDQPYEVVIKLQAKKPAIETTTLNAGATTEIAGNVPFLNFNCKDPIDCTKLVVKLGADTLTAQPTPSKRSAIYLIPLGKINENTVTTLTIAAKVNNQTLPVIESSLLRTRQTRTTPPANEAEVDLDTMLKNPCLDYIEQNPPSATYDEERNLAQIYVLADGTMLTEPPEHFDDNDTIELHIIADEELGHITARRTSPLVRRELHVVGQQRRSEIDLQDLAERPCKEQVVFVSYFDAPRGEVQLRSGRTVTGSFELPVNRRYWGMYSLGPAYSSVVNQSFKLVKSSDNNVIAPEVIGDNDLRYALFVTPFLTGKRDIEKPLNYLSLRRFNLTVGVTVQEAADNFLFGGTYEIGGVLFTAGRHWSRVTVLDPASGLTPGSPFTGTAAEIPTAKERESDWFYAVSLDLRVALDLFTNIVRGAGNQ